MRLVNVTVDVDSFKFTIYLRTLKNVRFNR